MANYVKSRNLFTPFNLRRGKKKKKRKEKRRKETEKYLKERRPLQWRRCTDPLNFQTVVEHARTRVCTLVSYKCANLSVNARACARGVHVLSIVPLGPFERRRKGDGWEGEEEEEEESYMKITYSVGPALKRPRTYNRGQLKSLVYVNARSVIFRNPVPAVK